MVPDVDRSRAAWWVFGITLGVVVLFVLYQFVGTFVFGLFLYYATRPVYRRVRPRVEQRSAAAALSLLILVGPALLLVSYTAAIAFVQLRRVLDRAGEVAGNMNLEEYEVLVEEYLQASEVLANPQQLLTGGGVGAVGDLLVTSAGYLTVVGIFLLHLFVIVAVAFYLLRDDRTVARWFRLRFSDDRGVLEEYLGAVDEDFNNIFFGNILNAVATATIAAIAYSVLNLVAPTGVAIPYAALIGLLAGVASLVPVVGMKLVYFPVGIYLFAVPLATGRPEAIWFPIVFAAVSFVVVDTIPDLLLRPYVSGRSLHMGALMLAYVLGPLLFGFYGLFLAPMLLVLVVHFVRIILPELLEGEPIRPYAVDPTYLAGDATAAGSAGRAPAAGAAAAMEATDGAADADERGAAPGEGGGVDGRVVDVDRSGGRDDPGDDGPDGDARSTGAGTGSPGGDGGAVDGPEGAAEGSDGPPDGHENAPGGRRDVDPAERRDADDDGASPRDDT